MRNLYNKITTTSFYSTIICESIIKNQIQNKSICSTVSNSVHLKSNQFNFFNKFEIFLIQNTKMSSSSKDIASGDDKMVVELDILSKTVRNVQTQHGDFRSVDEENIVLVKKCIWTEGQATDDDGVAIVPISDEEKPEEQVVWIEPFSEVSIHKVKKNK